MDSENLEEYLKQEKNKLDVENKRLEHATLDRRQYVEGAENNGIHRRITASYSDRSGRKRDESSSSGQADYELPRPGDECGDPHFRETQPPRFVGVASSGPGDPSCSDAAEARANTPKTAKERANEDAKKASSRKNPGIMEEWVSDTFYSYFPSFNVLNKKREILAQDRQRDYKDYLKKVSEDRSWKKSAKNNKISSYPEADESAKRIEKLDCNNADINYGSVEDETEMPTTKFKLLQDLKHTSLSTLVTDGGVSDRNRIVLENEKKKKLDYQQQLLRQIDEKRKEVEELKKRERLEEELLAKKIEEQIKTMQLEDELEKEKLKAEKLRLSIEQNQSMQTNMSKTLNGDEKLLEKCAQTTNKSNNVYKYFSNSTLLKDYGKYSHESFFEISDSESEKLSPSKTAGITSLQRCKSCDRDYKTSKCLNNKIYVYDQDAQQNSLQTCKGCNNPCFTSQIQNTHCLYCHRQKQICIDCMRNVCTYCAGITYSPTPQTSRSLPTEAGRLSRASTNRSFKILDISYEDGDNFDKRGSYSHPLKWLDKSFSPNGLAYSTFDPDTKASEPKVAIGTGISTKSADPKAKLSAFEKNTNDRLSKYLKNYGDLNRSPTFLHNTKNDTNRSKATPTVALLREPAMKIKTTNSHKIPQTENATKMRRKWNIPSVQKNTVSSSSGVLTQTGAFKKQLQIDKLKIETPASKQ